MASNPYINGSRWRSKTSIHILIVIYLMLSFLVIGGFTYIEHESFVRGYDPVGAPTDSFGGIAVYSNGPFDSMIYGLSIGPDGYLYGYKWQCVEFVRRFYKEHLGYPIPNGFKHAKYYVDSSLAQGELNPSLGLTQYLNGGREKPQVNDILVFTYASYGHVAIISEVQSSWIEIVQQNRTPSRQILSLEQRNGHYTVGSMPAAWLRLPNITS